MDGVPRLTTEAGAGRAEMTALILTRFLAVRFGFQALLAMSLPWIAVRPVAGGVWGAFAAVLLSLAAGVTIGRAGKGSTLYASGPFWLVDLLGTSFLAWPFAGSGQHFDLALFVLLAGTAPFVTTGRAIVVLTVGDLVVFHSLRWVAAGAFFAGGSEAAFLLGSVVATLGIASAAYTVWFLQEASKAAIDEQRKKQLYGKEVRALLADQDSARKQLEAANAMLRSHASALEKSRAALEQRNAELAVLADTFRIMSSELERPALLARVLENLVPVLRAESGSVMLVDRRAGGELRIEAAIGLPPEVVAVGRLLPGRGVAGWVVETNAPLLLNDPASDMRAVELLGTVKHRISSIVSVPLHGPDGVVGTLNVENRTPGRKFVPSALDFLTIVAAQLSVALERVALYERLRDEAVTDPLTGLYNQRYFWQRIHEELSRAERYGTELSLMMVDLDGFKRFNDTYGHPAGDEALKRVARILQDSVRQGDVVARYGGEEFVVVCPNTGRKDVTALAERLRQLVERVSTGKFDHGGRMHKNITLSMGVAVFPHNASSAEDLVASADSCLYAAKESGRNRVCVAQ